MRRPVLLLLVALAVGGCGETTSRPTLSASSSLVDRSKTPYVNALEVEPDGSFLMTTNKGFYRVAKDGSKVTRVRGAKVSAPEGVSPVGTFLEIARLEDGELVGSGHPDDKKALPPFLGFMRSNDDGKTWSVVSRLGTADLHIIRELGNRLYAWDAVLGAVLITEDGGRTWKERFTPKDLVLDMVVDPKDPKYILISTENQVFKSQDEGKGWRPVEEVQRARFAWLPGGELFRATEDRAWEQSTDRGQTWRRVGELPGEPWKIKAIDPQRFFVALADGSIASTTDGGRSWRTTFKAS
jgi:photosystem II stability/assembly factor-like uncharacterized protein